MIQKQNKQDTFLESFLRKAIPQNAKLVKIDEMIDWEPLRNNMETSYRLDGPGRPAFPPVILFKALLLQNWYNLSDPGAEEAIADRLSFRNFLGLKLDDKVPDHSTIHRFRDRIEPIMEELFDLINEQLSDNGFILKKGTMIDASVVQSAAAEPNEGSSENDPDATWTRKKKGGKLFFGYKVHIGVDQGSEIIRKADITPANIHDNALFEDMVSGDEETVYADKGYFGKKRSDWLKQKNIGDGIMIQKNRYHPMPDHVKAFNRQVNKIRRAIEHIFGTMKLHYRYIRCRYYCLRRNRNHFFVLCTSYNLRRAIKLA